MIKTCLFLSFSLFVVQIIIVNSFSLSGEESSLLKQKATQLSVENQNLKSILLEATSLNNIYRQAQKNGLFRSPVSFEKPPSQVAGNYGTN